MAILTLLTYHSSILSGIFKYVTTSGQNNGKEVFARKMERPDNGEAAEIQMHRQRHVELEKEFILSTLITLLKTKKFKTCKESKPEAAFSKGNW